MWINLTNLVLCFCFCVVVCHAYQRYDSTLYSYPRSVATTTSRYHNLGSDVRLRHSKFENLARLNSKIDTMNDIKTITSKHKLRHTKGHSFTTTTTTTTENSLFDNYGDFEDDDNVDDDDYIMDDNEEYDDSVDSESNVFDDWQAEEATEKPAEKPIISSFSEYKWKILGTREKVEDTRKQELHLNPTNEQISIKLAREHYMRVRQEGACSKPKPRVVYVQSEHPNPNRKYTPHCTVLHRCSEDTGCCNHGSYRCQYKTRVEVQLYFYARTVGETDSKVVKLPFYNHTACECKDINRNETDVISLKPSHAAATVKSAKHALFNHIPENLRRCECPEAYKSKPSYSGKCICDCDSFNEACILFKKGVEHFSYKDRKCITGNQCGTPVCEYGIYNRDRGKCPTRQERFGRY